MTVERFPEGLNSLARIMAALPDDQRQEAEESVCHVHLAGLPGAVDMALRGAIAHTQGAAAAEEWSRRVNPGRYTDRDLWLDARREGTAEPGFQPSDDTESTAGVRLERLRELHGRIAALVAEEDDLAADLLVSGLEGMDGRVADAVGIPVERVRGRYGR
ncbi:hypothetical protein ACIQVO_35955 [Streptomyces sp. NPDC101062]|uniref:hypothetical protein n=1 Tax=unclassified Streptomyces TaxID=2593676 RepID=UPI003822F828